MRILLTRAVELQMQALELTKVVLVMREVGHSFVEKLTLKFGIQMRTVLHKETVRVSFDRFLDQVTLGFGLDLEISWAHDEEVVRHLEVGRMGPYVLVFFRRLDAD